MKQLTLIFILCTSISTKLLGQDSLSYGQTFLIEDFQYPSWVSWNGDWAEKQFEKEYSSYFDSIAHFIRSNPQAKFQIRCYTEVRGIDSTNLLISQNRADDWVRHLTQWAIDTSAIEGIGVGETFPRKVWHKDSLYYTQKPEGLEVTEVDLSEDYINSFRNNRDKFDYLHQLNRRTELVVSELDHTAQRRVDYALYLKKLYSSKQVEMIGLGTIQQNDTIRLNNKGALHLHLVAIGTENEFTIRSLENPVEKYYHHVFYGEEEKLLDISQAEGIYEIEQFGDGGYGKTILFISK